MSAQVTLSSATLKIALLIHSVQPALDDDHRPDFRMLDVKTGLCREIRAAAAAEVTTGPLPRSTRLMMMSLKPAHIRTLLDRTDDRQLRNLQLDTGSLRDIRDALRTEIPAGQLPVSIDGGPKLLAPFRLRLAYSDGRPVRPYWAARLPKVPYLKPVR